MDASKFYGGLAKPRPALARTLTEDDEVDLIGMDAPGGDSVRPLAIVASPRQNATGLPLQQRSPHKPASTSHFASSTPTSRIEVILGGAAQTRPTPHFSGHHSDSPDDVVKSDVGPKSKHRKPMVPTAASTLGPKPPRTPATVPASKPAQSQPEMRKKGRPAGWRPGMSYSGKALSKAEQAARIERFEQMKKTRGTPGARHGDTAKKKRGRPAKDAQSGPRQIYKLLRPGFIPFGCEWLGCKAELQNMATLRRHVMVVHRRSESCQWGKCTKKGHAVKLAGEDDFKAHMESVHLVPYVWHMGDGHRNRVLVPKEDVHKIPLYLTDENGNQVTSSIKDQVVEDFATWRANRRRLRDILTQRDENAPSEEDDRIMSE